MKNIKTMSDFKFFYYEFLKQLEQARKTNNPANFNSLLKVIEPDWNKDEQGLYVSYCMSKAGIYALFGESLDMDDWMQKALQFTGEEDRAKVYFQWISLYWSLAKAVKDQAKLQAIFSSLFNVSSQAILQKVSKYDLFAFQSIRAFTLAALGKHGELEEYFSTIKWQLVPTKLLNDKTKLIYFYSHIYKILIAALEIRSKKYVAKTLQMITIDDALMLSKDPLFRKFNTVIMDIADMRTELAIDFNTFYQLRKKWAGFLPNFSLFTMMIEEENIKGLDLFFKGME